MSRNSIFIILGVISAGIAYLLYPLLAGLVQLVITERLPYDFSRMLQNSDLVAVAGFTGLFGLLFLLLYVIFPVSYVWYHINSAQNIIRDMPKASNVLKRTDKTLFLSQLKDLGFIGRLAEDYSSCLIQGPQQEVSAEILKESRLVKKKIGRDKNRKVVISPVRATVHAGLIFNVDSLVNDNLLLGLFNIFSAIIIGIGVVLFGISLMSFSVIANGEITVMLALRPGMVALLYSLVAAVIISGVTHMLQMILEQNSRALAGIINALFHQGEWPQDINDIQGHLLDDSVAKQFESIFQAGIDKPMREISRAIKLLTAEQEKKLDSILAKTLDNFVGNLEKKSASDMENLNKALKDAAHTAEQMKKQFAGVNSDFSRQMDKQATAIARHLVNMQKVLGNSEITTQKGTEKIISSLATEVKTTYERLDNFMKSNLKKLDDKQAQIEKTLNDKNSILKDLHSSAKDLGTISNASGMLLERFIALSGELDAVLRKIQQNGFNQGAGNIKKRDQLRLAMVELKKTNTNRTSELPGM